MRSLDDMRRGEAFHRALVEHASDICLVLHPKGTLRHATSAIAHVLGFFPQELTGRPLTELLHPSDGPYTLRLLAKAAQAPGRGPKLTFRMAHRDGGWRVFDGHVTNLLERPEVGGLIMTLHDVTEREAAQAALLTAHDELRRVDAAKDEFLSTVSHELRSPLTAILNAAAILKKPQAGELTPTQDRFVAILAEQADRLNRLVDDLLDLQKIETGNQTFSLEPLDLCDLVRRGTAGYAHVFEARRIALTLALGHVPLGVRADAEKLTQVLLNLLSNAAKFTPEGGHVKVHAERAGDEVRLSVEDSGPGIPQADLERIFQKFVRVDGSLTRQAGGTGLGLSICQQLIERGHSGRIWAESAPGRGATIRVALPAH